MLEKMFNPNSVAVIGASRTKGKVGRAVLENLMQNSELKVIPINPNVDEILGLPCYPNIIDVPGEAKADLAVIVVPAKMVPGSIDECGQAGVENVIVISAGFKEAGVEGARLERECISLCEQYGMKMIGPNCLGIIDTASGLNASFAANVAYEGNIALMSQSGAICTVTLDWAERIGAGFSKFISLGNKAVLAENEFLQLFENDPSTAVIAAYLEGVKDGPEFIKIAQRVSRSKPIIIVKSGRTSVGSRAVSSHTGTLAGSDAAYNAGFKQGGVIRADSLEEMLDYSRAFSVCPLPEGRNIAIITNAGGLGILTADACYNAGLSIASFEENTIERLREKLPAAANFYDPVDVLGDAGADLYEHALDVVLEDINVNGAIVLVSPQSMTDVPGIAEKVAEKIKKSKKPILCNFAGGSRIAAGEDVLNSYGIPNYSSSERAVASMNALCNYYTIKNRKQEQPEKLSSDTEFARSFINRASSEKRRTHGLESMDILKAYDIPVVDSRIAKTLPEAIKAAEGMGYPVVMKILSPDISHKTDVGGIRLNLKHADDVERAYNSMMSDVRHYMPEAAVTGVQLQKMIGGGKEVIIGMDRDPQFGPLLMFGLGGTYVEFLKDVSFAVAPITVAEAKHMVSSIKTYPLIAGVRGETASDIDSIVQTLLKVSQLVTDFPEILEFEINPLMVMPEGEGCVAMDIRFTLES
ncbi:acetate--CoA ligase family protein [Methanolobus mangrovi]|uniref:acetate--CoA ligase (ADP-forming) n=1 Tax=Methanolobus mangrovi TaxID=3072977 RepID=A0AA51UE30_9EURY|nr:acetate--CoA ligase family protein [Methanolobus mangrovi]WMW21264.1 acetate--CoA ligase family protein [Methanolobus mangrovi]